MKGVDNLTAEQIGSRDYIRFADNSDTIGSEGSVAEGQLSLLVEIIT